MYAYRMYHRCISGQYVSETRERKHPRALGRINGKEVRRDKSCSDEGRGESGEEDEEEEQGEKSRRNPCKQTTLLLAS